MSATAPIGSDERIGELDVLRGFALLGVFVVHFTLSAYGNLLPVVDQNVLGATPQSQAAMGFTRFVFYDKANTLFATLFGMGFWVMMERLQARGAAFGRIYLRRLVALLLIGWINIFLIFPGDVLHEYAMFGFLLFALRGMPRWLFIAIGLGLAIFGFAIEQWLVPGAEAAWEQFDTVQAAAIADGRYWNWVITTGKAHVVRELVHGTLTGWGLYIFGRFLIGAWIIRKGWLARTAELLPHIRRLALVVVPVSLALATLAAAIGNEWLAAPGWIESPLHNIAVLSQALGYALLLILLFHSRWRRAALVFAPVGRMALTAYVAHAAIFSWLLFPFGLGMLGTMSPAMGFVIALLLCVAMTAASHWWLARYRYGPLEYLWRWATYGRRPQFALAPAPLAA